MEAYRTDPNEAGPGGNLWDHARREYLSGVKAATICQRYGMSLASFRLHARAGGWRRIDQSHCDIPPEPGEYHPDDDVSFATLADQAFLNIRRALGNGRASEASSWMRLYDKLADRARADVMADLPDAPPPEPEQSPIRLTLMPVDSDEIHDDIKALYNESDTDQEHLDSLDSVFSESNPPEAQTSGLRSAGLKPGLSIAELDTVPDPTPVGDGPRPANMP